mmetsp:Transcript_17460/g.35467  ORF Transcript_17460/g.35467 Transcript_17460/m.35467 type:complete len:561 (+) Transcript_17460:142-1824(+)
MLSPLALILAAVSARNRLTFVFPPVLPHGFFYPERQAETSRIPLDTDSPRILRRRRPGRTPLLLSHEETASASSRDANEETARESAAAAGDEGEEFQGNLNVFKEWFAEGQAANQGKGSSYPSTLPPKEERTQSASSRPQGRGGFEDLEWMTEAEREQVRSLREKLSADMIGQPPWPELTGDIRLLRYVRKYHGDLDRAADAYRQSLAWRATNDVDMIREDIVRNTLSVEDVVEGKAKYLDAPSSAEIPPEIASRKDLVLRRITLSEDTQKAPSTARILFRAITNSASWLARRESPEYLNTGEKYLQKAPLEVCYGLAKGGEGDLVQYLRSGIWDTKALGAAWTNGKLDRGRFLRFWAYMAEIISLQCERESRRQGRLVRVMELVDVCGCSADQVSKSFFKLFRPWVKFVQRHYPETNSIIFFVRAPRVFSVLWKLLCSVQILDENTLGKVRFVAGSLGKEGKPLEREREWGEGKRAPEAVGRGIQVPMSLEFVQWYDDLDIRPFEGRSLSFLPPELRRRHRAEWGPQEHWNVREAETEDSEKTSSNSNQNKESLVSHQS